MQLHTPHGTQQPHTSVTERLLLYHVNQKLLFLISRFILKAILPGRFYQSTSQYYLVRFGVTISVVFPGHSNKYDNFHGTTHHTWKSCFFPRNPCDSLPVHPLATGCFQKWRLSLAFTLQYSLNLLWLGSTVILVFSGCHFVTWVWGFFLDFMRIQSGNPTLFSPGVKMIVRLAALLQHGNSWFTISHLSWFCHIVIHYFWWSFLHFPVFWGV